ncbi:MAG: AAA family ATPase [Streptosporangiaceae bacterium]|nr:AAA family ATPase [Streptosporangiaceae bacterium]
MYRDETLPDLLSVGRGIADLAATFTDPTYGVVPEHQCTVVTDEGDMRLLGRKLRLAAKQAEDLLLVYYTGHGLVGGRRHELYLGLPDSEWAEPEFNSLDYDKLRSAVLDSPAVTKMIILDCCFSGRAVTDTMSDPVTEVVNQAAVDGTYVLTSAYRDKAAIVIPGEKHTAFTGRLLKLLQGGVPGGPEFLIIDDIYQRLHTVMQSEGLPLPQKRGTDSAGLIALARNRAYEPAKRTRPFVSVDNVMTELEAMVGQEAVKAQIRSITHSIEAARRRAEARITDARPMRHFVFLGPPGTGDTTVARVLARLFYAFGLLEMPDVILAHRADLVSEYPGVTARKTNELVDSALGGVLLIDDASTLINEGDGQADRFGAEALQTLLKRAEDDREKLIVILGGYEKQMELLLSSHHALASLFVTRLKFVSFSPEEMMALAGAVLDRRGEELQEDAEPVLRRMFVEVDRRRITDELGNGMFVRNLLEKAGQARDVRVMSATSDPAQADLVTIRVSDLEQAYAELIAPLRGYQETPTVEGAIAELEGLVSLTPVKERVRVIAAQLRVAKLRESHGLASHHPARNFIFTGPPGTGKSTVARILGRIFASLGLLLRSAVIEAERGDFVGENLGTTTIKTNKLIDAALGGVLFIDQVHSLHNAEYANGDPLGAQAVQIIVKRAETDRDQLVTVLAGYPGDMDQFLRRNPALSSRFSTRIEFPSYSADELSRIAAMLAEQAEDTFDPAAAETLHEIFMHASDTGRTDEFGNGWFARSLFEHASAYRDLRVARMGETAAITDLTTITDSDVIAAYQEQTTAWDRQAAHSIQTSTIEPELPPATHVPSVRPCRADPSRNGG